MKLFLSTLAGAVFLSLASAADAQSLSGIRIGDDIAVASQIGFPPVAKNRSGPFAILKWKFDDGNELSVTALSGGGTIVYLETDWGGQQSGSYSDFPGFYYGRTALFDIRKKLGSNGFAFGDRTAMRAPDGSIVMFNSYEPIGVENVIVTFITKISQKDLKAAPNSPETIPKLAKLQSIILGYPEYLRNIWGSRLVYDPAYQKINWR